MTLLLDILTGGALVALAVWAWDTADRLVANEREWARLRSHHNERGADRGHGRPLRGN